MSTYDGTSLPTYGAQRPNLVGTPKRNHGHGWINNFFTNPEVFVLPPLYAIGDTPRTIGTVRTPYWFDADMSVLKTFSLDSLRKGSSIEIAHRSAECIQPSYLRYTGYRSVDDPNFGVISYT